MNGHASIRSFDMLGGAIGREAVTVDGEFGSAIENRTNEATKPTVNRLGVKPRGIRLAIL